MLPRIGLALGSGGARGWAHIGVLRSLEAHGIRPDVVCGSSAGALVGGAYASGNLDSFTEWVTSLTRLDVLRMLDFSIRGGGLMEGTRIMGNLAERVRSTQIETLEPAFAAVATELQSGREFWFTHGGLHEAIRASIALPGAFTPVFAEERWLVDGGLVNPVPVSVCRALGADLVIAVNLNSDWRSRGWAAELTAGHFSAAGELGSEASGDEAGNTPGRWSLRNLISFTRGGERRGPGMLDVLAASINVMQDRIMRSRMAGDPPELVIAPRTAQIGMMDFHRAAEAIPEGEQAVTRALPWLEHSLDLDLGAQDPP